MDPPVVPVPPPLPPVLPVPAPAVHTDPFQTSASPFAGVIVGSTSCNVRILASILVGWID